MPASASFRLPRLRSLEPLALCATLAALVACSKNTAPATPAPAASAASAASGSVSSLQSAIPGLTAEQASQSMGATLAYAKGKLPPDEYAKLASSVPGADAMVSDASKLGAAPTDPLGLQNMYKKIGLTPDQVNQMVPAMTDMVTKKAGAGAGQAFKALF